MEAYRLLEWDTEFFGFGVAQIMTPQADAGQLASILAELRRQGTRLVYWPAIEAVDYAAELGGKLVDQKTTFVINLEHARPPEPLPDAKVEPYDPSMPAEQLMALAVQCGEYSRFAIDPGIPREKYVQLYTIWITRSITKELADEILVIRDGEKVVGMATIGDKKERGNRGLVAVDRAYRGRRYGQTLVRSAQQWFRARGHTQARVVTQSANVPACKLYLSCGYHIEKVEPYYHFWL